jgi:hypothetical protein
MEEAYDALFVPAQKKLAKLSENIVSGSLNLKDKILQKLFQKKEENFSNKS